MNPKVKTGLFKAGEWIGLFIAFGVVGSLWINTEVERRMNELMPEPPVIAEDPVVVTLVANAETTGATLIRIEGKVDAFSTEFLKYLERQANK